MASDNTASGMETQKHLSEFLYAELLHSLGVYNGASDKLEELQRELEGVRSGPEDADKWRLNKAAEAALHCNSHLRDQLHHSADVDGKPTTRGQPSPFPAAEERAYPTVSLLSSIADFYEDVVAALRLHLEDPDPDKAKDAGKHPGHVLGRRFAFIHDPQRRRKELSPEELAALIKGKIVRNESRLNEVKKQLPPTETSNRGEIGDIDEIEQTKRFRAILQGDASSNHSLLLTIIQAMSEAHMWMHEAEHIQSKGFGEMLVALPETYARSQRMLRYSLVLNTFVHMAAESSPWIFAEDERERDYVITNYDDCVRTLAPTYCIWISVQLSLLALHRRAFTWWTMGRREWAYRDFHKLVRLLRGLREPAELRGLRVPGTKTFIEGLTGMAELHIGRIYRGQHAHKMALRYFERASRHLKGWEEHGEIGGLVKSSHWRVNLLLNEGEANYQLGRIKRSILCYAQAWRAYLLLVEAETHATANIDIVDSFTKWLTQIVDDPDVNRWELRARIAPLVDQFGTLRTPPHLRSLAADIVMRMGHLLLVLKLPPEQLPKPGLRIKPPDGEHDLAEKCMAKAAFLDPTNTMTATDLLKIEYQIEGKVLRPDEGSQGPPEIPLADQWPAVSGGFEEAAQVTEYVLQSWLNEVDFGRPNRAKEKRVALDLLRSFLAHTDSSNVKLAQVYRYLMQDRRDDGGKENDGYSLDFVCMRRYSSFFPFLPRPSAFRAPGGGYFVKAHEPDSKPFGIVVDPGPDFIENLYRCGFALADIQMIVITHDHADHIASLDALLALIFNRGRLTADRFSRDEKRRLVIVGNESVCERYDFFNQEEYEFIKVQAEKARKDAVQVLSFEEIHRITHLDDPAERAAEIEAKEIVLDPKSLQIEPVQTWGHQDATGIISQGFLLSIGAGADRSSILFTGDTGIPPELPLEPDLGRPRRKDLLAKGDKGLREAIEEADVIVAHLSSVPLVELRALAGLNAGPDDAPPELVKDYAELWEQAASVASEPSKDEDLEAGITEADFLLKQIQFGFRVMGPKELGVHVSPFDPRQKESQSRQHLYLRGLLDIAKIMATTKRKRGQLLLLGELREELGTFRTSIATAISDAFFRKGSRKPRHHTLTADIGLRVRLNHTENATDPTLKVLCTTCDLDNDLVASEKFHAPSDINEVCVKGEDEGVFYNCWLHNPRMRDEFLWVESVERYDVFGE